jgi:hypothetical protein
MSFFRPAQSFSERQVVAHQDLRAAVDLARDGDHVEALVERGGVVQVGDLRDVDALGEQRGQHVVAGVEADGLELDALGVLRGERQRRAVRALGVAELDRRSSWAWPASGSTAATASTSLARNSEHSGSPAKRMDGRPDRRLPLHGAIAVPGLNPIFTADWIQNIP